MLCQGTSMVSHHVRRASVSMVMTVPRSVAQEEYRMWQRSTAPVTHDTEEAEVQGRETSGGFGNGKLYRPQVRAWAL